MNKKKWIKKIRYLSYILTLSAVLISCSKKEGKGEEGKMEGSYSNLDEEDSEPIQEQDLNLEFGEDAAILPGASAVKLKNTYICYDMDVTRLKEYQDSLIKQGYRLFLEENVGGYAYNHYTNGDNRIQVAYTGVNVFISIVRSYQDMEMEEGIVSSEEVLRLIKDNDQLIGYVDQDTDENVFYELSDIVVKHWISDLYEKTKILAYSAYTKQGNDAGTYLIYERKAYRILDSLEKTCVADINRNGTYELLSLHGFGFGTYRINLNVYQAENPITFNSLNKILFLTYRNSFVPKRGYGNLEFNKVSETEVHLLEVEEIDKVEYSTDEQLQEEQLKEKQIKDYGALTIAEDDIHIVLESMEDFPYYQWDYDYTISQSDSEDTDVKVMKQIPKLEVSVGDTKLNYVGRKIDWNGEKEEAIEFPELMDDTIPMFDYPNIARSYTEDICLTIEDAVPTKIYITDYLITEDGEQQYKSIGAIERAVRIGEDGNYYIDFGLHTALFLSSSSEAYTNPSYRGFRVTCEFGDKQICEYVFVVSVAPQWKEEN